VSELGCRVCGGKNIEGAGEVAGRVAKRTFQLAHCLDCRFSFVVDPWTAYDTIYSESYYHGRGTDPSVDYVFELEHPAEAVRQYEWEGVQRAIRALAPLGADTRWLDFGCGNGGLVRWARQQGIAGAVGYETGWIASPARERGIPILTADSLAREARAFDVITAIEVLEHVVSPLEVLEQMAGLLKPGGLLFVTTGNARPFRGRLREWRYVVPEVHVSFFEPETLARAMRLAGLDAFYPGFVDGFEQIIRFKILKALGVRRRALWERAIPWRLVARAVDARLGITAQPAARLARKAA
jgi:SAM-dependent methyltransferase